MVLGCVSQIHSSWPRFSFPQLPGVLTGESLQLSASLGTALGPRGLAPEKLQPPLGAAKSKDWSMQAFKGWIPVIVNFACQTGWARYKILSQILF